MERLRALGCLGHAESFEEFITHALVNLMQPLAVLGADEVKKLSPLEAVRELSHAL
jgi:hypothetical protein